MALSISTNVVLADLGTTISSESFEERTENENVEIRNSRAFEDPNRLVKTAERKAYWW